MQDQAPRQLVLTTQTAVDPNRNASPTAFFLSDGTPIDLAALLSDFETRIAALEAP